MEKPPRFSDVLKSFAALLAALPSDITAAICAAFHALVAKHSVAVHLAVARGQAPENWPIFVPGDLANDRDLPPQLRIEFVQLQQAVQREVNKRGAAWASEFLPQALKNCVPQFAAPPAPAPERPIDPTAS